VAKRFDQDCVIWGLSPDLFEDPSGWFSFWNHGQKGVLESDELGEALAAAYLCDSVGTRWVKSYVNIHHRHGITVDDLLGEKGLLNMLQVSEEFASLREERKPPLFPGKAKQLTDSEHARLLELEERLEQLRRSKGWVPGSPAPAGAQPLLLPDPSPEGSSDPEARMRSARRILAFSLEQTRELPGSKWQNGFKIEFQGQEGVDDGGLTKAWVAEIAYALWGDSSLFDVRAAGFFFKPDEVDALEVDGMTVQSVDLYRWAGRFAAYAIYQRCLVDCRFCPWVFRSLQRAAAPKRFFHSVSSVPAWSDTPEGEDAMLDDLSSLDHIVASSLWRVRHEMNGEELKWLDFTCAGFELEPSGADRVVTVENRAVYVRLCCNTLLRRRCQVNLAAFHAGFLEVVPALMLDSAPEGGLLRLLVGEDEVSDAQISELERLVVPKGLVPEKLRDNPKVRQAARWVFEAARASDPTFRSRLLEFWLGTGRVPLAGVCTILPRPRLQVMVQQSGLDVARIASWPHDRLPEGHTCGNELWIALSNSYEEAAARLRLAVGSFEAGFALK